MKYEEAGINYVPKQVTSQSQYVRNSGDVAQFIEFPRSGSIVSILGLRSNPEYNSKTGLVVMCAIVVSRCVVPIVV